MRAGPGGQPPPSGGETDALRDMTEALTSLGNYLAAAERMVAHGVAPEVLRKALEKAQKQHERCILALRRCRRP